MNCPENFLIAGKIKSTLILLSSLITVKATIKQEQLYYLGKQVKPNKIQEIKENILKFHQNKDWDWLRSAWQGSREREMKS